MARQFCFKIISYWTTWTFQNKDNSESNSCVNKLQNIGNVCAKATLQACCKFRIPFIYLFAWGSHFSNHKQYSFCLESTKRSLTQIHHQEEEQSRFYLLILIAHIYKTKAVFLISANEYSCKIRHCQSKKIFVETFHLEGSKNLDICRLIILSFSPVPLSNLTSIDF